MARCLDRSSSESCASLVSTDTTPSRPLTCFLLTRVWGQECAILVSGFVCLCEARGVAVFEHTLCQSAPSGSTQHTVLLGFRVSLGAQRVCVCVHVLFLSTLACTMSRSVICTVKARQSSRSTKGRFTPSLTIIGTHLQRRRGAARVEKTAHAAHGNRHDRAMQET